MPTTRKSRTSGGPATKGSQKTLAFTSHSKVTKPSPLSTSKDLKPASPALVKAIDVGHVSSEVAVEEQAKVELERITGKEKTEDELKASKVTDAQIKKYWRAKEAERKAGRVHQQDLDVEEKVLRLFDMSSQYGPCIGIARMKRWVRANKLGLNPPIEVLAVLLKEEEKGKKVERAYIDELMSSKVE